MRSRLREQALEEEIQMQEKLCGCMNFKFLTLSKLISTSEFVSALSLTSKHIPHQSFPHECEKLIRFIASPFPKKLRLFGDPMVE